MKNILIISSSLGDLNGFVEHLEEYRIAGKIYAANVMDAGLVKNQSVFQKPTIWDILFKPLKIRKPYTT